MASGLFPGKAWFWFAMEIVNKQSLGGIVKRISLAGAPENALQDFSRDDTMLRISMIAGEVHGTACGNVKEEANMKRIVHTESAPKAIGPYSQAAAIGDFLYTSGQLGIDVQTGKLAEGSAPGPLRHEEPGRDFAAREWLWPHSQNHHFPEGYGGLCRREPDLRGLFPGGLSRPSCVQVAALPLGGLVE